MKKVNYNFLNLHSINACKQIGFTLAEVLITLSVIGIVAALTIPQIKNYAYEIETVSKVKSTYAILSDAVTRWQQENSCLDDVKACPEVYSGTPPYSNAEKIVKGILANLKTNDVLFESASTTSSAKEWIPKESYHMDGIKVAPGAGAGVNEDSYLAYNGGRSWSSNHFFLPNGSTVKICGFGGNYLVIFDVNAAKKPNKIGQDQFIATLSSANVKKMIPYYSRGDAYTNYRGHCIHKNINDSVCNSDDGKSPLAYVLIHNKLPK